jgi:glycosyltransferase involved in cell wall biosynthesis
VIIPALNARGFLQTTLQALAASTLLPHEVVVVNDGSTDGSGEVAESYGAKVFTMERQSGPARARNAGARVATGEILFFLDADVCVHPDTVLEVATAFTDPVLDAMIGSYDDDPASSDFLSQYKNLMHCFVHQTGREEASTFWSGCGAIRRAIFLKFSGFDEGYKRPQIEDIELGYRLTQARRRIVLNHNLRVKHLKRWSFWGLIKSDILDRGIPWTELILRDQRMPNDLNLHLSARVSIALVYLMLGMALALAIHWGGYFLAPLFALLFFLLSRYWVDGSSTRPRAAVAVVVGGKFSIAWLCLRYHMLALIPPVLLSVPALLLWHRYGGPRSYPPVLARLAAVSCLLLGLAAIVFYLPSSPLLLGFTVTLLAVVILNSQFYVFLAGKRGRLFALAALPFHLLYYFYNGLSFAIGLCRWTWKLIFSSKPPSHVAADYEKR